MRVPKLRSLLFLGLTLAAPLPLAAQRMICLPPAVTSTTAKECTLKVTGLPSQQVVVLRIENAPPNREVRWEFKWSGATPATPPSTSTSTTTTRTRNRTITRTTTSQPVPVGPTVAPPNSGITTTDARGTAIITWTGQANAGETVIQAEAMIGTLKLEREIRISPATVPPANRALALPEMRSVPHWFEERQLIDSVRVIVVNPGENCSDNVVQFRPYGTLGAASPDSVRAVMLGGNCVATTWWRLGKGIGRQHLRASLADDASKTTVLTAIARGLPRIGAGVALSNDFREYRALEDAGKPEASIDTVTGRWDTEPVAIVDFPVVPQARWLRGALGASIKNPIRIGTLRSPHSSHCLG